MKLILPSSAPLKLTSGRVHPAYYNGSTNQRIKRHSFICFDVCDFYPSITEKLLSKALHFAGKYRPISSHERDIILHAKRSLLFSNDSQWEKKSSNDLFDITMGSFNGAEMVNWLAATCYPSLPKSMAKASVSTATMAQRPSTKHRNKLKRSKRKCAKFSAIMA